MSRSVLLALLAIAFFHTALAQSFGSDPDPHTIRRVHHLDVGYSIPFPGTPPLISQILNLNFFTYLPQAIENGRVLAKKGLPYHYLAQPWLIYSFLHCSELPFPKIGNYSVTCPGAADILKMKTAILNGTITWHAFPFNCEIGMMSGAMVDNAVKYCHALDDDFDLPHKTILSQRDVPGMTVGALPTLVANGLRAVSIGVNPMSAPPAVPKIFRWLYPLDPSIELVGMSNPHGYGSYDVHSCVYVKNWNTALAFDWRLDNTGPGNVTDILAVLSAIRKQFPNAKDVFSSTFEAYLDELQPHIRFLPVVQAEIGDTWNYGLPTDPYKVKMWRQGSIYVENKMKAGEWNLTDPATRNFLTMFLKAPEHTWGSCFGCYLHDWVNWENEDFYAISKNNETWEIFVDGWIEERAYTTAALQMIGLPLPPPSSKAYEKRKGLSYTHETAPPLTCSKWTIAFSSSGQIAELTAKSSGKTYFNAANPIGFFQTTYDGKDLDDFWTTYIQCLPFFWPNGCPPENDFNKPGLDNVTAVSGTNTPTLVSIDLAENCGYVLEFNMAPNLYGTPSKIFLTVGLGSPNQVEFDVAWAGKSASRMPEAYWFSLTPVNPDPKNGNWTVDKAGYPIAVDNIVLNGTRHLHDSWGGVFYSSPSSKFALNSTDVPVIALGERNPFSTPLKEYGDPNKGIHFNLFNNIWDTNYPLWYPYIDSDVDESWSITFTVLQ